jgi:hypothetical protein
MIDLAELGEVVLGGRLRILREPRIRHGDFAARRGDLPGGLAEPLKLDLAGRLRHRPMR